MTNQTTCGIRYMLPCMVFTVLIAVAMARIGFQKDLNMDAKFPPPIVKHDPAIPVGHMRPLGWQRRSDGPVEEVNGPVSTIEFYNDFVSKEIPIVMRNELPETANIFENWKNDSYLVKQYGHVEMSVRVKTGRRHGKIQSVSQTMPMKKFISEYKYEEWYLSSVLPVDLMEEVPLPSCVRCGSISERLWSAQMWMSSGGTSSRVHSHDDHLLHCVLFGRRDFILIEEHHRKAFDFVPDYSGSVGGHSDINTEFIDMFKFGQISRVPWTWATVLPGDCIFVPAGIVHQVRSYGRSVSTTIEFSPLKEFESTGCTLGDDDFAPLSDAFFQWTFDGGLQKLRNKNLNADDIRSLLICLMGQKEALAYHRFDHFYSAVAANTEKIRPSREVYDMLTKGQVVVTEPVLLTTPKEDLSRVAEIFNQLQKSTKNSDTKDDKRKKKPRAHEEF